MPPHKDTSSPVGSYTQSTTIPSSSSSSSQINNNPTLLRSSVYSQPHYNTSFESTSGTSSMGSPFESTSIILSMDSKDRISHILAGGVCVPTPTFFDPVTEDLDLPAIGFHAVRLAKAGVTAIAVQGSNGEAVHLIREERNLNTLTTRKALDEAGFPAIPIIAGCGAQSVRETILLCRDAHENGADIALILPPCYYSGLFSPSSATSIEFFTKVADASPIPVMIYNYPGAVSGIDLSSDVITQLSKHENIIGVKLTCGNTGKLTRIVAATTSSTTTNPQPDFLVLGGSADFTLQTLIGGGHGILAGLANIAPKTCVKIITLYQQNRNQEALDLQRIVARADWEVIKTGVVGTKSTLQSYFGYGGFARAPLPRLSKEAEATLMNNFRELVEVEIRL